MANAPHSSKPSKNLRLRRFLPRKKREYFFVEQIRAGHGDRVRTSFKNVQLGIWDEVGKLARVIRRGQEVVFRA